MIGLAGELYRPYFQIQESGKISSRNARDQRSRYRKSSTRLKTRYWGVLLVHKGRYQMNGDNQICVHLVVKVSGLLHRSHATRSKQSFAILSIRSRLFLRFSDTQVGAFCTCVILET